MATNCKIPIIDLQDFPNELSKLMEASQTWRCFRLVNYQQILPLNLMSEMKSVVRPLFDLPEEIKRRNVDVFVGSGYMAPSAINPLYESLGVYNMASPTDIEDFCSQMEASPHQREIITTYAQAIHQLFLTIAQKLLEGLGVVKSEPQFQEWPCHFRFNKYHFSSTSIGSGGVQIHTDSGFMTILQDDDLVGGLEVMDKYGNFISVDPWPGTLVVNLGDMARVWSNGRLCNVRHRVQCREATIRISIASFLLGPRGVIKPLPELVDDEHPCVYVPTTYEDARKLRMSTKLQAGEALKLLERPRRETDEESSSNN